MNWLFKKRSRVDLIESAAIKFTYAITQDLEEFDVIEQAKILKRANVLLLERFSDKYDAAYAAQQEVLTAKEILK